MNGNDLTRTTIEYYMSQIWGQYDKNTSNSAELYLSIVYILVADRIFSAKWIYFSFISWTSLNCAYSTWLKMKIIFCLSSIFIMSSKVEKRTHHTSIHNKTKRKLIKKHININGFHKSKSEDQHIQDQHDRQDKNQ